MKFFLFFISLFFFNFSSAQKKKEIKKFGIKSVTVTETKAKKTIIDSRCTYNSMGQLIIEVKYDSEGQLNSTTKYKYNTDGEVIEETEYDSRNGLTEKRTSTFNSFNQKIAELTVDKNGKQIKKSVYTYNTKGLRSEKKVYDGGNTLISTKKASYEFK